MQVKQELRDFQERTNLTAKVKDLLSSLKANELDIESVLKIKSNRTLPDIINDPEIIGTLQKSSLQFSEINDTRDLSTFSHYPLRFVTVDSVGNTEIEQPIYLILQIFQGGKWSELHLFYLNKGIEGFLEKLSSKTIVFKKTDTGKKWIYYSSDSGNDWQLQNIENETSSFKKNLSADDIERIKKHPMLEFDVVD